MGVADYGTAAQTTAAPSLADWAAAVAAALDSSDVTVDARDAIVAAAAAAALAAHEADTTAVHGIADTSALAPLASPTFTGTPAAPTAASATSTTQLATTAFVMAALGGADVSVTRPNTDDVLVTVGGQTVHYDSGWRDVSSLLVNGWNIASPSSVNHAMVRRRGDRVTFWWRNSTAGTTTAGTQMWALPAGFGSHSQIRAVRIPIVSNVGASSAMEVDADSLLVRYWVSGAQNFFLIEWETDDPFPTSLPGTLVSSAPA